MCHLCGVPGQLEVGGVVDGPQPQQALVRRARVVHRRAHVVLAPRGKNIFCEVKIFSPGHLFQDGILDKLDDVEQEVATKPDEQVNIGQTSTS